MIFPRLHALDRLDQTGDEDEVLAALVEFLDAIGEATVAESARRAIRRAHDQ